MAKLQDKLYNRVIHGKFIAESGDELPTELPEVSASDNGKVLVVSEGKWQKGTVGGTQLYKHECQLMYNGMTQAFTIFALFDTDLTTINEYPKFSVLQNKWFNVGGNFVTMSFSGGIKFKKYNFTNNTLVDLSEYQFITDTVTPL